MKWKTAWSYLPVNFATTIGTIENITQRTYFWNNINGNKIKIQFNNRFSDENIVFEKVTIARKKEGKLEDITTITYKGEEKIEISAGAEFFSDEIEFQTMAGIDLVISCYIKERTNVKCACANWARGNWYTKYILDGDYTEQENIEGVESYSIYDFIGGEQNKYDVIVGISDICIYTKDNIQTIALFGDSITHMSYYSNALMKKLYKEYEGRIVVLNRGYGGNRVLKDASYVEDIPGHGVCAGIAGIARFENDVFGIEQPDYVFLLEGVNDLMHPYLFHRMEELPCTKELEEAFRKFAEIAHEKGSKIYFSTIMPLKSDVYDFGEEGERIRKEFNSWLLKCEVADGIFDFAKYMKDENERMCLKSDVHIGDGLHPNEKGGEIMAKIAIKIWKNDEKNM